MLRKQDGVLGRAQALGHGLTRRQLEHRIRPGGPWQRLLPGVYLAVTGTPTRQQLEIAALAYAGPGSAITGLAALRLHGIRVPDHTVITVLVRRNRGRGRAGQSFVRLAPTTRMPERVCVTGPVDFTMVARAIADAARELPSLREFRALVADSVQQRFCSVDVLARELSNTPRKQSGWLRQALAEVADGVRSVAEADLRDLIMRSGLPRPMFNARLFAGERFLGAVDAWWPDAAVAAEVDSREWHLSPEDWERTLVRHTRMGRYGILVQHFTPRLIRNEPGQVVADLRAALQGGRVRPALDVRARPAS
ncbi:MAG TPA: hypothetical protein VIP48_00230 [Streptosporangiaceae bacterium]